jgi:hypothetical protein
MKTLMLVIALCAAACAHARPAPDEVTAPMTPADAKAAQHLPRK